MKKLLARATALYDKDRYKSVLPAPLNEAVDMTKPYFAGPARYVNVPDGAEGPLFAQHNHDAALTVFPSGDVFIADYTCDTEFGHAEEWFFVEIAGRSAFTTNPGS